MIVEVLIDVVFLVINGLCNLIPSIPAELIGGFAGLLELASKASFIVPWSTLFAALGVWILMQSVSFVSGLVNWLIKKIPTIS